MSRFPMRYHAVVFHPGPRTRWRTARTAAKTDPRQVPVLEGEFEPDPEEIIIERSFLFLFTAEIWVRAYLLRLKNVCAEIHDTTHLIG